MKSDHYAAGQRIILGIAYALHILLIPAILGVAINMLKIREYHKPAVSESTRHREIAGRLETHHVWLLRTFLISLFFMAAGYGTAYWGVGYLLGIGAVIWWVYRMVRGIIGYAADKPMPVG